MDLPITLSPDATMPEYKTEGAAGMDVCAAADVTLQPLERKLIPTGLRVAIPEGFEGQIRPRSGLALKQGITMLNSPGTIDSDFRGEIGLIAINLGNEVVNVSKGDRVAQLVICPVVRVRCVQVASLDTTDRGEQGFGSTGIKNDQGMSAMPHSG